MQSPEVRLDRHGVLRGEKRFGSMRCVQGIVPASNAHMCSMMRSRSFASMYIVNMRNHYGHTGRQTTIGGPCHNALPLFQRPQKSPAKSSFAFHLGYVKIIALPRSYTIKVTSSRCNIFIAIRRAPPLPRPERTKE